MIKSRLRNAVGLIECVILPKQLGSLVRNRKTYVSLNTETSKVYKTIAWVNKVGDDWFVLLGCGRCVVSREA